MSCELGRSRVHGEVLLQEGGVGVVQSFQVQVVFAFAPFGVQGRQLALLQAQRNRSHDIGQREAGYLANGDVLHVGVLVIVVAATHVDQLDGGDGPAVQVVVLRLVLGLGIVQRLV